MQRGQRRMFPLPLLRLRPPWAQSSPCRRHAHEGGPLSSILITGGAGFIGSHLADELLRHGYVVRVLDSLVGQVHGESESPPYLSPDAELIVGDVRDGDAVRHAIDGVDAVVHLAARVGVGQSMYELSEYTSANSCG